MAAETHLTAREWRQFLAGELDARLFRTAVRHLLAGCPACSRLATRTAEASGRFDAGAGQLPPDLTSPYPDRVPAGPPGSDGVVARLVRRAQERHEARQLWDGMRRLAPAERLRRIEADPSLPSLAFCERLVEACGGACWSNPRGAADLARLAVAVAIRVPRAAASPSLIGDLRGRALACLADARRVNGDLDGAWDALARSEEELDGGSGDPLETAILRRATGDLLADLWRLDEAADAYCAAAEIYAELDDLDLHGQTLVQLAGAVGPREPERAIGLLEMALAEMEPGADLRPELRAVHGKIWFLNDAGRHDEAAALLEQNRRLYRRLGDPPTLTRLLWLEARIALRQGRTEEAEASLQRLWHRMRDIGLPLELCLLSVDLIETYLAQGKTAEAAPLAHAFQPVLRRYGREDEAAALGGRFGLAPH